MQKYNKRKKQSLNKFFHNQTTENFINYKRVQAQNKRIIKQAKVNHWKKYCNEIKGPNYTKLWRTIKAFKGQNKNSISPIKDPTANSFTENDKQKADILANHFSLISGNNNHSPEFDKHKNLFEMENCDTIEDNSEYDQW